MHRSYSPIDQDSRKELEQRDDEGYTALLTTAKNGGWTAAEKIIVGMYPNNEILFDTNYAGDNLFTIAVKNGESPYVKNLINILDDRGLLNHKFEYAYVNGESATETTFLHWTAGHGALDLLKLLIETKHVEPIKDSNRMTPIHLAIQAGQIKVFNYLLDREPATDVLLASLPLAAGKGLDDVFNNLLKKIRDREASRQVEMTDQDFNDLKEIIGSEIDKPPKKPFKDILSDVFGRALIHAAANGQIDTVVKLLALKDINLVYCTDATDKLSRTALEAALDYRRSHGTTKNDAASTLLSSANWEKFMLRSNKIECQTLKGVLDTPMRHLIKEFPDLAEQVMDHCINNKKDGKGITYNFELLDDYFVTPVEVLEGTKSEVKLYELSVKPDRRAILENHKVHSEALLYTQNRETIRNNHPLMLMLESNNVQTKKLLEHELVTKYLEYRWTTRTQFIYYLSSMIPLCFFIVFFLLFLIFVNEAHRSMEPACKSNSTTPISEKSTTVTYYVNTSNESGIWDWIKWALKKPLCFIVALLWWLYLLYKELSQLYELRCDYWKDKDNWVELGSCLLSGLSFLFAAVVTFVKCTIVWHDLFTILAASSVMVLLLNLLLNLIRWQKPGLFILMVDKVFRSFWPFTYIMIVVILGFSLVFYFLLQRKLFSNVLLAPFKIVVMSTGEFDYNDIIGDLFENLRWSTFIQDSFALLSFIIFLFLVYIVAMNVFTGLAIGDIQEIQKEVHHEELAIKARSVLMATAYGDRKTLRKQKYRIAKSVDQGLCKNLELWKAMETCTCFCDERKDDKKSLPTTAAPMSVSDSLRATQSNCFLQKLRRCRSAVQNGFWRKWGSKEKIEMQVFSTEAVNDQSATVAGDTSTEPSSVAENNGEEQALLPECSRAQPNENQDPGPNGTMNNEATHSVQSTGIWIGEEIPHKKRNAQRKGYLGCLRRCLSKCPCDLCCKACRGTNDDSQAVDSTNLESGSKLASHTICTSPSSFSEEPPKDKLEIVPHDQTDRLMVSRQSLDPIVSPNEKIEKLNENQQVLDSISRLADQMAKLMEGQKALKSIQDTIQNKMEDVINKLEDHEELLNVLTNGASRKEIKEELQIPSNEDRKPDDEPVVVVEPARSN